MCMVIIRLKNKPHAAGPGPMSKHRARGQIVTAIEDETWTPARNPGMQTMIDDRQWGWVLFPGIPVSKIEKYRRIQYDPFWIDPNDGSAAPVLFKAAYEIMLSEVPQAIRAKFLAGEMLEMGVDFTWPGLRNAFRRCWDDQRETSATPGG